MNGFRQRENQKGPLVAGEENRVVVQIRGGVIVLPASTRLRVTVGDPGEVVHQHQGRVVREQQTPRDRLPHYAHTVTATTQESAGD